MAKATRNDSAIQKVAGTPDWLARYEDDQSTKGMDAFVIVPRLKIIQSMSDQALKKQFGEGSVIVRPGDALVASADTAFTFVPQFFFSEYCKWADRRDTTQAMIIQRTYDPTSELAKRCADPKQREELYEGHEDKDAKDQWHYRYVHHFCFPGVIYGEHGLAGTPVVLSFERGEFGQGRNFISAIKMRKTAVTVNEQHRMVQVPLWAQVWELQSAYRDRDSGKWYGFDFKAAGMIDDARHGEFHAAHLELQRLHNENKLRVDHGEQTDEDAVPAGSDAM